MLNLEKMLMEDESGQYRDKICEELESERRSSKRLMDSGLPTDEFRQHEQYVAALDQAVQIVQRVWKAEHSALPFN